MRKKLSRGQSRRATSSRTKVDLQRPVEMENNLSLTLDALASSGIVLSNEQKVSKPPGVRPGLS